MDHKPIFVLYFCVPSYTEQNQGSQNTGGSCSRCMLLLRTVGLLKEEASHTGKTEMREFYQAVLILGGLGPLGSLYV